MNNVLLVLAALLPAVALCIYIFIKDRAEKEPIGLLLLLFGLGVVICFPAAFLENRFDDLLHMIFEPLGITDGDSVVLDSFTFRIYNIIKYFLGVGLIEEGLKWAVLILVTRKNKNFNSLFDGIIYAVFVSLGFAAFENVLYVLDYGWINAIMRALMSVPGHMFNAVIMGYHYSMWHMYSLARDRERQLKRERVLHPDNPEFSPAKDAVFSLLLPVLCHGFYDYCCSIDSLLATVAFYAFLLFLYIFCFARISKMSKSDQLDHTYSNMLVLLKYPTLMESLQRKAQARAEAALNEELELNGTDISDTVE